MMKSSKVMGESSEKAYFLGSFVKAFQEQLFTDILIKPNDNGPAIPAHKAVLAARSRKFRFKLYSDECKDSITIQELNHEELKAFLEFLYNGNLNLKVSDNPYGQFRNLYIAANIYDILYLEQISRKHLIKSVDSPSVINMLELGDTFYDTELQDAAIRYIQEKAYSIVMPVKYFKRLRKPVGAVVEQEEEMSF